MPTVNNHITIPKNVSSNDDLSFDFLRKQGIAHIESLGNKFWTDYNTHDPGITILEVLCYAITDLGMRMELPIENLLHSADNPIEKQFFTASEILPVKPVTALDYRKIILDIDPRIKNCWLQPYSKKMYVNCKEAKLSYHKEDFTATPEAFIKEIEIKGLYKILVDFEEKVLSEKIALKDQIREQFHANRNLCEDLVEVEEIGVHPIAVCFQVDLDPEADEEFIYAKITVAIKKYLSPAISFRSLAKMSEKGYTSDQIFEGPLLKNGFIDDKKLRNSSLRTEVRLSDLMRIIMKVKGVKFIRDISINNCDGKEAGERVWNICIEENKKPELCEKSTFNFTKGVLPVNVNMEKVAFHLLNLKKKEDLKKLKASENKEIEFPEGELTATGSYSSITHDFPETYGIGEVGLSDISTTQRKAKAKQLKGYLLFFDQILVSYFKHLNNVKELLSINNRLENTYFTEVLTDIEGFGDLVTGYSNNPEVLSQELFGDFDDAVKRKNKLKDHLISRFAERFSEYAFLMKSLYGNASDEIVLQNKADFLTNYSTSSAARGSAFNYFKQPATNLWNTFNVTGLENRIAGLLGIKGDIDAETGKRGIKRKNLSKLFVQIYDPTPATPATNFRWRIRNSQNKIVLSATEDYPNEGSAANELYFAVIKLFETSEEAVNDALTKLIQDRDHGGTFTDTKINTVEIIRSDSGKYSFHIINPEIEDIDNPDRIIARQYKLFLTLEEVGPAIIELMKFFKETFSDEGIFLVEHILLLPKDEATTNESHFLPICVDDCNEDCCIPDPYSFKISVVLPGYTFRFSDIDFRNYAEDVIRQEIPSHILGKICWIGHRSDHLPKTNNDLVDFEKNFKNFLIDKSQNKQLHLPQFINSLGNLNTIYPSGRLYNCEDETENISGKIILGRTNLGTI